MQLAYVVWFTDPFESYSKSRQPGFRLHKDILADYFGRAAF